MTRWSSRRYDLACAMLFLFLGGAGRIGPSARTVAAQRIDKEKASADEADRGRQLMQRGEYFEAFKAYKHASDLAAGRSPEYQLGMAQALEKLKLYKNAIETCDAAIPLATSDTRLLARAHNLKGLALEALGEQDPARLAEAESEFRQALAADPESRVPDLHFNLGVALMKLHRDEEGIAELKRELETRPNGSTANEAKRLMANPRRARENYAPDFSFFAAGGRPISQESLRGSIVLLDFWAMWSPPSVKAIPALRKLQKAHATEPLVIVSVSSDSDEHAWRAFVEKNAMTWPQFLDERHEVQRTFGVNAFPTYVLIDGEGIERLRVSGTGYDHASALEKKIDELLKQTPARPGASAR